MRKKNEEEPATTLQEPPPDVERRNARINELVNSMRDADGDNGLGDFEPLDHPVLQKRLDADTLPLQPESQPQLQLQPQLQPQPQHSGPSDRYYPYVGAAPLPSPPLQPPRRMDDRWMEKMNYIIHLLEQQQNEKTSHITEEFVLYAFLGVFVIFVVDAFSRGGKYVR